MSPVAARPKPAAPIGPRLDALKRRGPVGERAARTLTDRGTGCAMTTSTTHTKGPPDDLVVGQFDLIRAGLVRRTPNTGGYVSIERIFYCDGPECERHSRTTGSRAPLFLTVTECAGPSLHFCGWDCVLRHAAAKEPEMVIPGSPDQV
jgi:hypothetical protein